MTRTRCLAFGMVAVAGAFTSIALFSVNYFLDDALYHDSPLHSSLTDFRFEYGTGQTANKWDALENVDHFADMLCGGCYHAMAKPEQNIRCGRLIHDLIRKEGFSLRDAANKIATMEEYRRPCFRCLPNCPEHEKTYWRYDSSHIVPPILTSTMIVLDSIPSTKRIPAQAIKNLTEFFSKSEHSAPLAEYFFDYNPSIVILPSENAEVSLSIGNELPVYLASYRVSTQQSCFHPYEAKAMYGGSWGAKPPVQDYLALAFLRADLSIIKDVVVDLKASEVFKPFAEDFRLFVFNQQVYVASFDYIAPIWVASGETSASTPAQKNNAVLLKNAFPSNLKVFIRSFPSCPVCYNRPGKRCGKNLNYFSSSEKSNPQDTTVLVELWPSGPHVVQQMDLDQPCSVARSTDESAKTRQTFSDDNSNAPLASWHTMEEVMFPDMAPPETILTRGRGGACCISIVDPRNGNSLHVGIYHIKIPKFPKQSRQRLPARLHNGLNASTKVLPNQYLSRWYTFQPTPPYRLVAESGLFCLGYPDRSEHDVQPLVRATLWKRMVFGGDVDTSGSLTLNCPRIHFVSGITEKADDPSRVVVSYGINDCVSRLVEFEKGLIMKKLFGHVDQI